jgi:VanZ family protein
MFKALDLTALLLYCLLIYWLSDQHQLPSPDWFPHQDKLHHAGAYFCMAILAWRCFKHVIKATQWLALASFGFCCLYGLSDEWHQSFVAGRESDLIDWLADSLGAFLAAMVLRYSRGNKQLTFATLK